MKGVKTNSLVDISNVPLIEIATGTHASLGEYKFRTSRFEFDREIISIAQVYEYILFSWGAFVFLILAILSIYFTFTLKAKIKAESNLIQINEALARRSKELEYVNKRDELTGVLNRTGMQDKMLKCIQSKISPLTIVMIDIDNFKMINDD